MDNERESIELQTSNDYGTKPEDIAAAVNEGHSEESGKDLETLSGGSDIVNEDDIKQKWWIKFCPCLLRWQWLRARLYKNRDKKDKGNVVYIMVND